MKLVMMVIRVVVILSPYPHLVMYLGGWMITNDKVIGKGNGWENVMVMRIVVN